MRRCGNSKPEFWIAARTRSRASRTAASASPTIVNAGRPGRTSTSTDTGSGSTPSMANVATRASTTGTLRPRAVEVHAHFVTTLRRRDPLRKWALNRHEQGATCQAADPRSVARHVHRSPPPPRPRRRAPRSGAPRAPRLRDRRRATTAPAGASSTSSPATARARLLRGQDPSRSAAADPFDGLRELASARSPQMAAAWLPRDRRTAPLRRRDPLRRDRRHDRRATAARRARAPGGGVLSAASLAPTLRR